MHGYKYEYNFPAEFTRSTDVDYSTITYARDYKNIFSIENGARGVITFTFPIYDVFFRTWNALLHLPRIIQVPLIRVYEYYSVVWLVIKTRVL